ncbi:MAG: helix-turn-helix domain-containing protein [Oscillospiraceae bacterium]|nr:helix-turn-helix domain-containing protein [Oscillospiraceae bacterium]
MVLCMDTVNRCLEEYKPTYCLEGVPELAFRAIVPYREASSYDAGTLYVGKASRLPYPLPRNFVGIGCALPPRGWTPPDNINLTILPESADFSHVLMSLLSRFLNDDTHKVAAFSAEVLEKLSGAGDVRALTEVAYRYLENPIVISDKNWRTMVLYPELDIPEDVDWMQFKNDGMLSIEVVTRNMHANLAGAISESSRPFRWTDDRMAYPRLFCNVTVGRHAAATLSVLEYNRPFTDQDHTVLALLADAVSAELQKSEKLGFPRGLDYENFLSDMLEGKVGAPAVMQDRIKTLNIDLKRYLCLFVIDVRSFDRGNFSTSFFRDYVERTVSHCKALVFKGFIVFFKSFSKPEAARDVAEIPELRDFLSERKAKCGVSRCFENITELSSAFHQGVEAVSIGAAMYPEAPFCFYEDLVLYHIAKICSEQDDLIRLCSPKLLELIEYDRQHNTAFTKSLYAWFASARNITRTAEALSLHRNSAIYHLKKIEEILGISLTGADNLLYLELSCRFLEYNDRIR